LKNIAVVDREFSPPAIVSTAFAILHPRPFVNGRFLFHWLRSKSFEGEVAERMKGVAYPAINDGEFRGCPVPLPPLAEQKRIVAKVDELIALCDRLEAQQRERETRHVALTRASLACFAEAPAPANLELLFHQSYAIPSADLRKAILTLAVQGKLVPQDPSERSAIVADVQSEDGPHDIPSNWSWVELASVAHLINGDRSKNYPSKSFRVADGIPFINAGHLSNGEVSLDDMDYIAEEHYDRLGSGKIEREDVLYCLRGSLGKCAVVSSISRGAIASSLLIIRAQSTVLPRFLYAYLVSPLGLAMIAKYDNGSAQPNLSATNVKKFLLPLPPVAEQRRIVAKVDELKALVDTLENQLATIRTTSEKLLAAAIAELTQAKVSHAIAEI
jgi:type I restriction enzyme S subunit